MNMQNAAAVQYRVQVLNAHAHLWAVELVIAQPQIQHHVSLPVWIPGSYMVREFSQHLQCLQAQQTKAQPVLTQLDKHSWRIDCVDATQTLVLRYQIYAFDTSVRTSYLDAHRGFFNGTSLLLRVHGLDHALHQLQVDQPPQCPTWRLATGLQPIAVNDAGFGLYQAPNYETLVDAPCELGTWWQGQFELRGVVHKMVVTGAPAHMDGQRLLADAQRICAAQMHFWHGDDGAVPFDRYVFLLNLVHDGYGGLEHHNSTALIAPRRHVPCIKATTDVSAAVAPEFLMPDGYVELLGLISHEYFHTWNVKRLRPKEFVRYDFDVENHTQMLWFFEGFTNYYDDLMLLRAGLIGVRTYLELLAKSINQLQQTPGRQVQTVAQASFDAWTKYYRSNENTANATVSYYTKGCLVAACLDLALRQHGQSLDQVMRLLWLRCQGGVMQETDLRVVLYALTQTDWTDRLNEWVHGTSELPILDLLRANGILVQFEATSWRQQLGIRLQDQGLFVQHVQRNSLAEQSGMASGDEWLMLEQNAVHIWRLQKPDDVDALVGGQEVYHIWVSRDRRVLRLPLRWPGTVDATHCKLKAPPANATTQAAGWPAAL